jgi:hypothetical protein
MFHNVFVFHDTFHDMFVYQSGLRVDGYRAPKMKHPRCRDEE